MDFLLHEAVEPVDDMFSWLLYNSFLTLVYFVMLIVLFDSFLTVFCFVTLIVLFDSFLAVYCYDIYTPVKKIVGIKINGNIYN